MKDRLCRSPEITFWCRGICVNFVSECHSFCHCAAFSKMKNVYSLFQSIYTLLSSFFLKHSKERYRCTSHWRVWAISIIHFLFSKNFVKLWTKSMMGKYDEHVLLWKFVNVIFKGCCRGRHLFKWKILQYCFYDFK